MPAPRAGTALQVALLSAIAVALVVIAVDRESSPGVEVVRREPPAGIDEIRVHVGGAVAQPGVVTVRPGGRIDDAVQLAGGLLPDADTGAINLSRRARDEDQVIVPRLGEAAALLDLNSASASELDALPGIGEVYAGAIIVARTERPFTTTDELVERGILPERVYAAIRDLVAIPPMALP